MTKLKFSKGWVRCKLDPEKLEPKPKNLETFHEPGTLDPWCWLLVHFPGLCEARNPDLPPLVEELENLEQV